MDIDETALNVLLGEVDASTAIAGSVADRKPQQPRRGNRVAFWCAMLTVIVLAVVFLLVGR